MTEFFRRPLLLSARHIIWETDAEVSYEDLSAKKYLINVHSGSDYFVRLISLLLFFVLTYSIFLLIILLSIFDNL